MEAEDDFILNETYYLFVFVERQVIFDSFTNVFVLQKMEDTVAPLSEMVAPIPQLLWAVLHNGICVKCEECRYCWNIIKYENQQHRCPFVEDSQDEDVGELEAFIESINHVLIRVIE
jgi:hypothetical protein